MQYAIVICLFFSSLNAITEEVFIKILILQDDARDNYEMETDLEKSAFYKGEFSAYKKVLKILCNHTDCHP